MTNPAPLRLVKKPVLKNAYPHHNAAATRATRWATRFVAALLGMTMPRFPDKVPLVGMQPRVVRVAHGLQVTLVVREFGNPHATGGFTPNLQRHVPCPPVGVTGSTVAEALNGVCDDNLTLRRYALRFTQ